MSRSDVTRPADLANVSLRELLDAWHLHLTPLVNARHGIGDPQPVGRLRGDALDMLACGQALVDQLFASRWVTAVEALAYGAPLGDVATAMGLDVDEVTAGLCSWADGQAGAGLMTAAERDEVYARATEDNR